MHARRRIAGGFAAAAALVAAFWSCAPGASAGSRYDLLLVTLDTVRADRLGAYGYGAGETPALDRLAREGVVFEHAQTVAPLTLPAHATLLSGLLPTTHGARDNGLRPFRSDRDTLATRLQAAGYDTAAFVGAYVLDRKFGLARGFDRYDDEIDHGPEGAALEAERRGAEVVDRALAWLEQRQEEAPFFAWVHLYDAHFPYAPPDPYRARFESAPYDGEIAAVDAQVTRLLSWLERKGRARRTLVVVAADHGEALGDHGERTHGLLLYDSTLRVPLLLRAPGMLRPGLRIAEPVSLADVAPSVSSLLGLPPSRADGLEGRDLSAALRAGREPERADLYAETEYPAGFGWQTLAALRRGAHKVITGATAELYDLAEDPAENRDLASARRDELGELVRALRVRERETPAAPVPAVDRVDRETAARLASLGYLAAAPAPAKGPLREPRAMLAPFALFEEAGWDRARGDHRAAVDKLRRALTQDAENPAFLGALAQAERAAGDLRTAAVSYRAAIARSPHDSRLWLDMAWTLQESGQVSEAAAAAQEALRLDASSGEAHNAVGICAALGGDPQTARSHFARATELEPRSATAWNNLGNAWRALRQPGEAADAYSRAAALAPGWADPLNGLGVIEIEAGRPAEALAYFDRALVLQPDFEEARRNRAVALRRR